MASLAHPYFVGVDDTASDRVEVVWERYLDLHGEQVAVALWSRPGVAADTLTLDAFEHLLHDLVALDTCARAALRDALRADPAYLEHHVNDVTPLPATLTPDPAGISVDTFVAAMEPTGIDLHPGPGADVALEYMIDPDEGDEAMVVTVDPDGNPVGVAWEH